MDMAALGFSLTVLLVMTLIGTHNFCCKTLFESESPKLMLNRRDGRVYKYMLLNAPRPTSSTVLLLE